MNFEMISIRGRFSYGLLCINNYMKHFSLYSTVGEMIKLKYAEFTTRKDLDEWYEECKEYTPEYFKHKEKPRNFYWLQKDTIENMRLYYKKVPGDLKNIWQLVFDIGREHLYSIVHGNSTVIMLEEIIEVLQNEGIGLPEIKRVSFTSISEDDGWGKSFEWKAV